MNLDLVKAVITGGASGLGQATAARLAAAGAAVALLDVQDEAGRKATGALGARSSYHHCDVTDESAVDEPAAFAQHGREESGDRDGGSDRGEQGAALQPHLGSGRQIGGDGR
jgi:NAD(P)-dependent dehydrogenase (short-subunit alcohol dehydrogenase family)